jgi:hypothetical protein
MVWIMGFLLTFRLNWKIDLTCRLSCVIQQAQIPFGGIKTGLELLATGRYDLTSSAWLAH